MAGCPRRSLEPENVPIATVVAMSVAIVIVVAEIAIGLFFVLR